VHAREGRKLIIALIVFERKTKILFHVKHEARDERFDGQMFHVKHFGQRFPIGSFSKGAVSEAD